MVEKKSPSLFDLTGDWLRLYEMADDDIDADAFFDTMEGIEGAIEDKANGYVSVIKRLENDIDFLKAQKNAFTEKIKAKENSIKRMKDNLYESMRATGKLKFKTSYWSFYTATTQSVQLDTDKVPERFLRYKDPEVDKAAIKEALKNGENLTGIAHLEDTEGVRFR